MKHITRKKLEMSIIELREQILNKRLELKKLKNDLKQYNKDQQTEKQKMNIRKAYIKKHAR